MKTISTVRLKKNLDNQAIHIQVPENGTFSMYSLYITMPHSSHWLALVSVLDGATRKCRGSIFRECRGERNGSPTSGTLCCVTVQLCQELSHIITRETSVALELYRSSYQLELFVGPECCIQVSTFHYFSSNDLQQQEGQGYGLVGPAQTSLEHNRCSLGTY